MEGRNKKLILTFIFLICFSIIKAEVPWFINYQGRLRQNGQPVQGTKTMRFEIWNQLEGGSKIWTSGDVQVNIFTGIYSYPIGLDNPGGGLYRYLKDIPWHNTTYYLQVTIDGNTELKPRERLTSVPYAFECNTLSGRTYEAFVSTWGVLQYIDGNKIFVSSSIFLGNVGIGTSASNYRLDVNGDINLSGELKRGGVPAVFSRWDEVNIGGVSGIEYKKGVVRVSTNTVGASIFVVSSGSLSGQEIFVVKKEGRVGIGTNNPQSALHVVGVSSFTAPIYVNGIYNPTVPRGGIVPYSGPWSFDANGLGTGELTGWALCDGRNGTPDLKDRFVMGTTIYSEVLTLGGTNFYYLSVDQLPSHTHTFTTDPAGEHTHKIGKSGTSGSKSALRFEDGGYYYDSNWIISDGAHTHSFTTNPTGGGMVIDNRPAFVKLVFIMKL